MDNHGFYDEFRIFRIMYYGAWTFLFPCISNQPLSKTTQLFFRFEALKLSTKISISSWRSPSFHSSRQNNFQKENFRKPRKSGNQFLPNIAISWTIVITSTAHPEDISLRPEHARTFDSPIRRLCKSSVSKLFNWTVVVRRRKSSLLVLFPQQFQVIYIPQAFLMKWGMVRTEIILVLNAKSFKILTRWLYENVFVAGKWILYLKNLKKLGMASRITSDSK